MKRTHKWIAILLTLALLVSPVLAATGSVEKVLDYLDIKVSINGEEITPTDVNGNSTEPFAIDGTVYLPVRAIAESLGLDVEWDQDTSTVLVSEQSTNEYVLMTQANDYDPTSDTNDGIYIAELTDQYFEGGVEVGLEALLNAGQVYINGIQIPAEAANYYMNGMPGIWEKEDGHWTWQAHDKLNADNESKIPHNGDYSFEFARRRFVLAVSALRGTTTTIYAEEGSNVACRVEFFVQSGAQVESITVNDNGTTTVYGVPIDSTSYNTDGGPNDIQPRTILTTQFDQSIEEGDTVLYWYDTEGWHMERCVPVQGLMDASDHFNITVGDTTYSDALIVRYNMQAGSRPSQFISAANNLELNDIPVTLWTTETGYVVGISRMEYAREALEAAIEFVDGKLDGKTIVASEDGTDVASDTYWVTQSYLDAFETAYDAALAALENTDATNAQIDAAIQTLGAAYGNGSKGMSTMQLGTK